MVRSAAAVTAARPALHTATASAFDIACGSERSTADEVGSPQFSVDVDFGNTTAEGAPKLSGRQSARPMQDQRNRALRRNSVEPFQIEGDRVGGESVHVSDRHCQSIDLGTLDKFARLARVGHGLRRKCIRGDVLVPRHRTEFGLDPRTGAMGECGRLDA